MRAYRIFEEKPFGRGKVIDMPVGDLKPGKVQVKVHYSSVNYKDALAGLNKGKILKSYPLNGGIDAAGEVSKSEDPRFKEGDLVLVNGSTLSEFTDGGYAEYVNVDPDWVVPLPSGVSPKEAMIYGTAGFTAALCLYRMEINGQTPEKGPIVVTGASGGVGGIALMLLKLKGYEAIGVSGKDSVKDHLIKWGASRVTSFEGLELGDRPLENGRFGGAIDNLGGESLSKLLPHINLWGNVASVGLAMSYELNTTVMPFILRGVSLLGASSNNCEPHVRREIWERLGADWKPKNLKDILQGEVGLEELDSVFESILNRKNWGRTIVRIN